MDAGNFKDTLAKGGDYIIGPSGVTMDAVTGIDTFVVPSGIKFKFEGDLTLPTNSVIIFENTSSVDNSSTGKIAVSGTVKIVGDKTVTDKLGGGTGVTSVPFETTKNDFTTVPTNLAVKGNFTIDDAGNTNNTILYSALAAANLYVVGNMTVGASAGAVASTGGITVVGDLEANDVVTAPLIVTKSVAFKTIVQTGLTLKADGNVTSAQNLTFSGASSIGGDLEFNGATDAVKVLTTSGTATLKIGGDLTAVTVTLGTATANALTVEGAATITGTLAGTGDTTGSVITFNGETTVDTFTSGLPSTVIAGSGKVTIANHLVDTGTNTILIKNTAGVTLDSATETLITSQFKVKKATIFGDTAGTGVTIKQDATSAITLGAGSKIITNDGGSIVFGTANTVTLTKATLGPGTYTPAAGGLTLTTGTVEIASGGGVVIAGTGALKFADNTAILKVASSGFVDVSTDGDIDNPTTDRTTIKFRATTSNGTASKWDITGTAPNFTVVISQTGNSGIAILGKIQFTGNATNTDANAGAASTAAAGKLTAGAGTCFIITGST
jgi:hypothetical protein